MTAAGGQVISSDPADLADVFQDAAEAISNQLLIEAELPADVTGVRQRRGHRHGGRRSS